MSESGATPLPRRDPLTQVPDHPLSLFGLARATDARSLAGPMLDLNPAAGTKLVREGEVTGTFYVIRSGTAELLVGGAAVATLGPGECFGESDPTAAAAQRYTVVAGASLRVIAFSAVGIQALCDHVPQARQRILAALPDTQADIVELPRARRAKPA